METAAYRKLLFRLLALPIVALALLASILVYGFRQVQRGARRVDRADQVIAHANNLIKLIVDEETGLRGYMLTRDSVFLQPYHEAIKDLDPEYATLFDLVRNNPEQTARLRNMQTFSRAWQQSAGAFIGAAVPATDLEPQMLERKREMDGVRAAADEFLSAETRIRADRSFSSLRIDNLTLYGLIGLAAILGALLAWEISRLFRKLADTYNGQLKEVKRWGDECYTREQWLNTTLRSIGDAVIACNPEGHVVFMNRVAEQLTGWKEAEADKVSLSEVFVIRNQHTRAVVENPVELVRRTGTIVGLANHTILISKDHKEINIDDSAAPILDKEKQMIGIVLVFRDVSERYSSERALMRAERLASAGRLAAAIAHEVNNPLEGLVNLVYLARGEEDLGKVRGHLLKRRPRIAKNRPYHPAISWLLPGNFCCQPFPARCGHPGSFRLLFFSSRPGPHQSPREHKDRAGGMGKRRRISPGDLQPARQQPRRLSSGERRLRQGSRCSQPTRSDRGRSPRLGGGYRLRDRFRKPQPYLRALLHYQERHRYRPGIVGVP